MQEPAYPDIPFGNPAEFLKTLPFSKEAEQSVLGGLMLNNAAWMTIADLLTENDFYHREHQFIFRAIQTLAEEGHPCDPVTLSEWLENNNKLDAIGGNSYLGLLARNTPSAANIVAYAKIVREHSILRQLVRVGTEIMDNAFNTQGRTSTQLLDEAEKKVFEIAELGAKGQGGFVEIKTVLSEALDQIERLSQQQNHITGIPTGFRDLDEMISGLQRSDFIIIAGRPSMGKCLASQAKIVDSTGQLSTIEEIYQRHDVELLTLTTNGQFQLTKPIAFVKDGIKPVFRLTTQLGRSVETTLNHPYLTLQGWKPLADLVIGEKIAVPWRINIFGTTTLTEGQIKLLATLVGNSRFSNFNLLLERLTQWVSKIKAIGLDNPHYFNPSIHWLLWFHRLSWSQPYRLIPTVVFTLQRSQLALFLNHLLVHSGWLSRTAAHLGAIGYTLSHEELARQVQHLLLRFGVIAAIKPHQHLWRLTVEQIDSLKIFISEIGLLQPPGNFVATQSPVEEIYWDEIATLEFIGQKPVYDLTIAETHNFVANDICVHNTSLAMNIAENVALRSHLPVAVFSMEMSNEQLAMRLIASLAKINLQKVRTGKLSDDDWPKLTAAISQLQETPLFIDDTPALNPTELRARVRRLAREQGELGLVVIDYLQLMQVADNKENRAVEVSEISRSLKALAKELNVPVIALSQLNRSLEQRPDKRPRMSDLRESGCLAGDSLVFRADIGQRVPIRELVGQQDFLVLGLNLQTMHLEAGKVSRVFGTGIKSVFALTTRLGRTIRATANHQFYTPEGWKRLDELKPGDYLAVPRYQLTQSDLYWDRIVSIQLQGKEEVFDLTIPVLHNFVVNDIVAHNSIEQDSDLIIFIYRDEVYNDKSEHKGIAEVIIAKQRNGPIGNTQLKFFGEFTKFENYASDNMMIGVEV